jgi:hypothetical protein
MAHGRSAIGLVAHLRHLQLQPAGCQGASKKKKKPTYLPTYLLFFRFFEILRSGFRKYLYGVFGLLMQRNGQKRNKRNDGKDDRKKVFFPQLFRPKASDMDFPQKVFVVFLNAPC